MKKAKLIKIFEGNRNCFGVIGKLCVIECLICKKHKTIAYSIFKKGHGKYCSSKCYIKAITGNVRNRISKGFINTRGYKAYSIKGKEVLEHRLVMEKMIGRKLRRNEEVHHNNGIRTDNTKRNLLLTNKREHAKIHYPDKKDKIIAGRKNKCQKS